MTFEPIAIVGRACLLPGARSPSELWQAVRERRDLLQTVAPGRWGLPRRDVRGTPSASVDRTWCERGGYVDPFELDREGFAVPADELLGLDPLFDWLLHCGREALCDAGIEDRRRVGAVIGNLSFPTEGMARLAERTWLGDELAGAADLPRSDPRNRFMSGLPAHLLAKALSLGDAAYCLDAACASSLVAIKLACGRLHSRGADAMLAGAVCRADDLFIHVGFCALQAMSRTGLSRPFHRDADGLVPAEGAGVVVLERLADAERAGRRILGVIRGVGLSNDGRGKGFLAPSVEGQVRAMREAYAQAGLDPADISYVECHATGTLVGDGTELRSMAQVFGDRPLCIGSVKSNLGHPITAAGVAGLIKVLAAMEEGTLPPTLHPAGEPLAQALGDTSLRLVTEGEPWPSEGPRRAAISAFGFGGNNAHLIVEEHRPGLHRPVTHAPSREPVAVVAVEVVRPRGGMIELPASALRFPPRDLEQALAQQLLMMAAADRVLSRLPDLPRERTGALVGMGCDPEIARYGARWRAAGWSRAWGVTSGGFVDRLRDAFVDPLSSAGVLGTMPNIVANRLDSAFDLQGPSMALSAEELSGVRALGVAIDLLRRGDLDAALVGAVDLSREPVHQAALAALGVRREPDDVAVALVLERRSDAERLGHPVLALIDELPARTGEVVHDGAHAAAGLLAVANAVHRLEPVELCLSALGEQHATVAVTPVSRVATYDEPVVALTLPAHPPAVRIPRLPAVESVATSPVPPAEHIMARAPALAPLTDQVRVPPPLAGMPASRAVFGVAHGSVGSPPMEVATPTQERAGMIPTPTPSIATPASLVLQQQALIAQQHQGFLAQQMALHQQFLATQARLRQQWLQAVALSPTVVEVRAPVPPPPIEVPFPAPPRPPSLDLSAVEAMEVAPRLPGFTLDREGLKVHASGRISDIFGPELAGQDRYRRQVRMPEPPLLLADRMTGIAAEIGSMGLGTIWTETDVRPDSWYLHQGRMPAGIMIESGQADLMLISYLGVDLLNRSERVYRLLGCELTYHGPMPEPGDTLVYDIHVDGHASQGDVRLFFFHYDCRVDGKLRLSVRGGQAGFFTDEELAGSAGVLWDAAGAEPCTEPRLDPPPAQSRRRAFTGAELRAFAAGRTLECFGPGFELACTHTRTPRIAGGRMLFIDEVTHFEPEGGPWGRGYLRAVDAITPDDWFFAGHFKNDPCMPGTLMFEGCLQTMAVYLAALGFTLERDGARFEPVQEEHYLMRCRGQVLPTSKELVYELFIEEVIDGPTPTIYADLLCTVDGLKAFHCRRMGLRLVPDWPLDTMLEEHPDLAQARPGPVASIDGFEFGYDSLLACAWGKPSRAFGSIYRVFDSHRRVARLPGPPYHFMTRVARIDGAIGSMQAGQSIEVEYDVPSDGWYFGDNGARTMPFCVLLEAALQPCGWLASFVGSALSADVDLCFRNLDGTGTQHVEVLPKAGTLRTRARIVNISATAGMIIESFEVECFLGDTRVYDMTTVFGFFPKEAFENQAGLPVPDAEAGALDEPSDLWIDLEPRPARFFAGPARLPRPMLTMLDRVTGSWPEGGAAGLGRYRAEKDVDPDEWFFKAHFFQDPVQPGSLGIEAMIQLLQLAMIDRGLADGFPDGSRFEPLATGRPLTWKYRGQVRPENGVITTLLDLTEIGADERGPYAVADSSLWVDGKRIYQARGLAMRIVPGAPARSLDPNSPARDETLDPERDTWLRDHCPTFTIPALPMMSMVDRLAAAARRYGPIRGMDRVEVERWLPLAGPTRLKTEVEPVDDDTLSVTLSAWRDSPRAELSRFEPVATATVQLGAFAASPAPLPPLAGDKQRSPYETGRLFHGPAFHKLRSLRTISAGTTSAGTTSAATSAGASAILDAAPGDVPVGALNQVLLDAATHAIPHDRLHEWCADIPGDVVAYPYRVIDLSLHGEPPTTGEVRCEVRFAGFDRASPTPERFPCFDLQLVVDEKVWLACRLVEVLVPKGPLGSAPPDVRRAFLRDKRPVPDLALSRHEAGATRLSAAEVAASNWLPGTLEALYAAAGPDLAETIAVKEHAARLLAVHPGTVQLQPPPASGVDTGTVALPPASGVDTGTVALPPASGVDTGTVALPPPSGGRAGEGGTQHRAISRAFPITAIDLYVAREGDDVVVRGDHIATDLTEVRRYWDEHFAIGRWPVEDLYYGLIARFVRRVHLTDPAGFQAVQGKSLLYLANHQVAVESLLFSILVSGLSRVPTVTLAKAEHRHTWLGRLIQHCFGYPGVTDPRVITYFDRDNPASLAANIADLAAEMTGPGKSVMVHIEGTRSLTCRQPVAKMTSAFIDMALATRAPIVPVRFVGGLPARPLDARIEFPFDMGQQDIYLGSPIHPETFEALPYKDRKPIVIDAINALGPTNAEEEPLPGDPDLAAAVAARVARTGASPEHATLYEVLARLPQPSEPIRRLLAGGTFGDTPEDRWLAELARRLQGPSMGERDESADGDAAP